jgi:hypothetical protein
MPARACQGRTLADGAKVSFEASAWHTWFMMYSVPILSGRLPDEYLEHWIVLIRAYHICLQWQITADDLEKLRSLLKQLVEDFKCLYIDCDNHPKRLMLYTTNIHGLLHLHEQIKDCGPIFAWDESSTESYMGAIEPMARSGVKIDESAANATFLEEMVKILPYARPHLALSVSREQKLNPRSYETEFRFWIPRAQVLQRRPPVPAQVRRQRSLWTPGIRRYSLLSCVVALPLALNANSFLDPILLHAQLYGDVEGPVCSYRRQSACYHQTGLLRMALKCLDVPGPAPDVNIAPLDTLSPDRCHFFASPLASGPALSSSLGCISPKECPRAMPSKSR